MAPAAVVAELEDSSWIEQHGPPALAIEPELVAVACVVAEAREALAAHGLRRTDHTSVEIAVMRPADARTEEASIMTMMVSFRIEGRQCSHFVLCRTAILIARGVRRNPAACALVKKENRPWCDEIKATGGAVCDRLARIFDGHHPVLPRQPKQSRCEPSALALQHNPS